MYKLFDDVDHMMIIQMRLLTRTIKKGELLHSVLSYSQLIITTSEGEESIGTLNDSKIVWLFIYRLEVLSM